MVVDTSARMIERSVPSEHDKASNLETSSASAVDLLLTTFMTEYTLLQTRLAVTLGSGETAQDLLQDIYLKLKSSPRVGEVRNPRAYLYRMAINLAKNKRRTESRFVGVDEEMIAQLPDEAPDQERALLASDEMERATGWLHSLPPRRRAIFLAKWRDDKTQVEIASEFGLHKRSVQKELDRAERFLKKKLGGLR